MPATAPPAPVDPAAWPPYVLALKERIAYLPPAQVTLVLRAYAVGAQAHAGQERKSGEPYITHPVAVASILAELGLDAETIIAAILHDTLEDTELSREALAGEFGEVVAELVDGVTKLDKMRFGTRQEADAESFRKMLLAMARDIRVILIKLADRLHNMRTLGAKDPVSRRRIARETLEIFAPIAQRLGMNKFKAELQDLGFRALYPDRYRVISERIRAALGNRREVMGKIETALTTQLAAEHLSAHVVGRIKSPWSIYSKMRNEHKTFAQLMDVYGFRVVVDSATSCYIALGAVHALYKPVDRRFKDFIAIPKANGYQSLHTVLLGPFGKARTAIRQYLKHLQHEDAVDFGHRMLDRALDGLGSSLDAIAPTTLERFLKTSKFKRLEELLSDIALGNRMPDVVARQLLGSRWKKAVGVKTGVALAQEKIRISGGERGVLSFANCCHPLPGDDIIGYLSSGKGIVVHRVECPNVVELRRSPERLVAIEWDRDVKGDYRAQLHVEVINRPGVLATVAAAIAAADSNIENVEYVERDASAATLLFSMEVKSRKHLADVIRRVRRTGVVSAVRRYPL